LKWFSSVAPLGGIGNRTDISYLIAGFLNTNYDAILSFSGHEDTEHKKIAYTLGVAAREKLYG
jgi:hypothetical protein